MIVLCIVGLSCLAAAVSAGIFLWRSVPGMISTQASIRTTPPGAPATNAAAGEVLSEPAPLPDGNGLAEGGLTDPMLKSQVWSTILSFYDNVRGCADVSSSRIAVSREPDATASWQETWDVVACGQTASLKILFTVSQDGGIFYDISE